MCGDMCAWHVIRYGERLVGLVVEEAHVVGQWQHDFREDYRKLPELRALTRAPWSLFSATLEEKAVHALRTDLILPNRESSRGSSLAPIYFWT